MKKEKLAVEKRKSDKAQLGVERVCSETRNSVRGEENLNTNRRDREGAIATKNFKLRIVPIIQTDAFDFIALHHRHHKKPVGSLFQLACADEEKVIGVAVVGRPVSRYLDNGFTAEVTRLCVLEGYPNACSMLYAACWRMAKATGYLRMITYILKEEKGTTLYASGWKLLGERGGGSWSVPSRPRIDKHPTQKKLLFEIK